MKVVDISDKLSRLIAQQEIEEENRRENIGRRSEDYVNRMFALMALVLSIISLMVSISIAVAKYI